MYGLGERRVLYLRHLIFFSKVTPDTQKHQSLWYSDMSIIRDYPNGLENAALTVGVSFKMLCRRQCQ